MTKAEGNGMLSVLRLASGVMRLVPEAEARSFVDGLTDTELAEAMLASSAAARAAGGAPNLLYESAAARLLKLDVEAHGSRPELGADRCPHRWSNSTGEGVCVRPSGHPGPCCAWPVTGEPLTNPEN